METCWKTIEYSWSIPTPHFELEMFLSVWVVWTNCGLHSVNNKMGHTKLLGCCAEWQNVDLYQWQNIFISCYKVFVLNILIKYIVIKHTVLSQNDKEKEKCILNFN